MKEGSAVYLQGNVGVGTGTPSALVQAGPGQDFGNITTVGVPQRATDTVALSLRSDFKNPTFQFCGPDCNYLEMDKAGSDLWIGTDGFGHAPSMTVRRQGNVGVGTLTPSALFQVGHHSDPNGFGGITTLGIRQRASDTVGLSVRTLGERNPVQQFCVFDCNYIEMDMHTNNLHIGSDGFGGAGTMIVQRQGNVGIRQAPEAAALAVSGEIVADTFTQRSSRRWKSNIETLHGALDTVERLRSVSYHSNLSGRSEIGFIAEEVGAVVPEVVSFEANGDARGIDYARMAALLVEAVKSQQAQIDALRAEVAALKRQN